MYALYNGNYYNVACSLTIHSSVITNCTILHFFNQRNALPEQCDSVTHEPLCVMSDLQTLTG